jgi:hypothetical protein
MRTTQFYELLLLSKIVYDRVRTINTTRGDEMRISGSEEAGENYEGPATLTFDIYH